MKKLVSILLVLCLCVGLCPALAEGTTVDVAKPVGNTSPADGAAPADATAPTDSTFPFRSCNALTKMGDQLLVYGDGVLYATRDGEAWATYADLTPKEDENPYSVMDIAASGDTVYLLISEWLGGGTETYALSRVSEGGRPEKIADLSLNSSDGWIQVYGMAYVKDALYLLYMGDTHTWGENNLLKISPADGSTKDLGTFTVTEMQPYKDDLLLVCYRDQENSDAPSLATLNPETKEIKTLATMKDYNCGAIAWDAETDTLLYADTSSAYRLTPGAKEAELCATLIPGYGRNDSSAIAMGGKYYLEDYNAEQGLYITSSNPADMPTRHLRLAVNYANDVVRAYTANHKEVAVQVTESAWDAETITQRMLTASDAADIYAVSLSGGLFTSLRDKGYCVDLSGNQKLLDFVTPMYPSLTKEYFRDGKLYALPAEFNASANMAYYPSVLAELGLTEDDLPKTWLEMMDFIQRWDTEIGPDCDDEYALFQNDYDIFSMLFGYILQDAMMTCDVQGDPIRLGNPETVALLKRMEELRPLLKRMSRNPDETGGVVVYGGGSDSMPEALIANYCDLTPSDNRMSSRGNYREVPLPLTIAEGGPVVYQASITLYLVNPNSKNQEEAMAFLEYLTENMDDTSVIALDPNRNDPVESPWFLESVERMNEYIASVEEAYETAPEEDKTFMQDALTQAREELEYFTETSRWAVSAESIAAYREIAPHLVASSFELLGGNVTDLSSIFQRFMDGQMSAEQFAKEFDRIIMMMEMENQ